MFKRLIDVVASAAGLLVLAPLFALIAVAIKLESRGPVFFRQERVGRHGRPFRIFKFRTMTVAPATGGVPLTIAGDARITRVGAVLRRTKIDELAQLIDVLRGTMSLVGPRPEVPRYVAHYPPEWRERLLSVRPGITDFASVRYRDENELLARSRDPEREYIDVILPTKLQYALHYVDRPTFANDLRVIGLTLRTVFVPSLPSPTRILGMNDRKLWLWLDQTMSALNPRNRAIAMAVDALVILAGWHLMYLFRLGFERWQPGRPWYDDYVSFGVVLCYLVFLAITGVPRGLWRFFGFDDFKRIALACVLAGTISAMAVLMAKLTGVARAVLLLHPFFCILTLSLLRMAYRMVWEQARSVASGVEGAAPGRRDPPPRRLDGARAARRRPGQAGPAYRWRDGAGHDRRRGAAAPAGRRHPRHRGHAWRRRRAARAGDRAGAADGAGGDERAQPARAARRAGSRSHLAVPT
jgi:lipopolysaccharide/colanic/teichoic acid biosynthesis glycosyltransferase